MMGHDMRTSLAYKSMSCGARCQGSTCDVHSRLSGAVEVVQLGMRKDLPEPGGCGGRQRLPADKHVSHSCAGARVDLLPTRSCCQS